jgi:metallophosphoesterase (TIGR03767 family)
MTHPDQPHDGTAPSTPENPSTPETRSTSETPGASDPGSTSGARARLPRRGFLAAVVTGAAALPVGFAAGRMLPSPASAEPAIPAATGATTTLQRTVALGDYLKPGAPYRTLTAGPGLPIVVRQDLAAAKKGRAGRRKPLAGFAHVTDLHVIDPCAPSHASFLRQYPGTVAGAPLSNAFRSNDALTAHVLTAMLHRINAIAHGPVTGVKLGFTISTGDTADTRGTHELDTVIDVLNGGAANAIATGSYVGIQDDEKVDVEIWRAFWHPQQTPAGMPEDDWKSRLGYPTVDGYLQAVSKGVRSAGLDMPWYTAFGNHDQLDAGVMPAPAGPAVFLDTLATGDRLPLAIPDGMTLQSFVAALMSADATTVRAMIDRMPTRTVPASAKRAPFDRSYFFQAHLDAPGPHGPAGHGFDTEGAAADRAYYRFDIADRVVGITLDSTNPYGGPDGSLDPAQVAWLTQQLTSVSSRYFGADGSWVRNPDADDRLVVIFSHHNSVTFDNLTTPPGVATSDRMPSAGFLDLLSRFPNVVLWVNGHMHANRVWAHPAPSGKGGGIWEINTASHIDFPQQARTIELVDNHDGTLSILSVLIDHSDPDDIRRDGDQTQKSLAALSLELALNDPDLDRSFRVGTPQDQNVELVIKAPDWFRR